MLLEELKCLFDKFAESEDVQAVLLFQLHRLQFLTSKGIADKAQLQVEVVRILWS